MAKQKKTHAPIHRQLNEEQLKQTKELYSDLQDSRAKLFQMYNAQHALTLNVDEQYSIVGAIERKLQEVLQGFEEKYGEGELDLEKGIYFVKDVREE